MCVLINNSIDFIYFLKGIIVFIYLFGCAGSPLLLGLFSSWESGSYSLTVVPGLLISEASLVAVHRL